MRPLAPLALVLAACEAEPPDWPARTFEGLSVPVPPGWVVSVSEGVLRMEQNPDARQPHVVWVWTAPPPPLPAPLEGFGPLEPRHEGSDPAPHVIVAPGGGSGGTQYDISIPKRIGERSVTVRGTRQTELGRPRFEAAWGVWRGLAEAD